LYFITTPKEAQQAKKYSDMENVRYLGYNSRLV
jgi:hypothetical protein